MKRVILILLMFFLAWASWVQAGKKKGQGAHSRKVKTERSVGENLQTPKAEVGFSGFSWEAGEVVEISAERMNLWINERKASFSNKVIVKKGGSVIYCEKLEVRYLEEGKIDWLKAENGVKIIEGDQFATGEELEYLKDKNQFWLRGNPKLVSKNQIVLGTEMIFDLTENRLKVSHPEIQFQKEAK